MQILPNGKSQFIDQNGAPLVNGAVYFYAPGTTNPLPTYQDSAGTIANTNPIQLDSRGQAIIWGDGSYRQIVKDASGVTIWDQVVSASTSASALSGTGGSAMIGMADGSTLASTFLSGVNRVVDSIAALRTVNKTFFTRVFVSGYTTPHDGGGGSYQYDASDTSSADNGGTIIVANDGGRWKLATNGKVSICQFGADATGATSSVAAINRAMAAVKSLYAPAGTFLIDGLVGNASDTVGWQIEGAGQQQTVFNFSTTGSVIQMAGDGCAFKGIWLKPTVPNVSALLTIGSASASSPTQSAGTIVTGCRFGNSDSSKYALLGLGLYNVWYSEVQNNDFIGTGTSASSTNMNGIVGNYSVNNVVTGNSFTYCYIGIWWTNTASPADAHKCEGWNIANNVMAAINVGIQCDGGLLPKIQNNIIDICMNAPIIMAASTPVIQGNWIALQTGNSLGICYLNAGSSNAIVTGNYFLGNTSGNSPVTTLQLSNVNYVTISGNTFANGVQGIGCVGSCGWLNVTGNQFVGQTVRPVDLTNSSFAQYSQNQEVNIPGQALLSASTTRLQAVYKASVTQSIGAVANFTFTVTFPTGMFPSGTTPLCMVQVADGASNIQCWTQYTSTSATGTQVYVTVPSGTISPGSYRFNIIAYQL
jgi:hypothetical protein